MSIKLTLIAPVSPSDYFQDSNDVIKAYELKNKFRRFVADEDAKLNILDNFNFTFSDKAIYAFLSDAIDDINSGIPKTAYTISGINDDAFVVRGAVVMALTAKGLLETKNNLSFNDQGLSVNTFDKGNQYQSWSNMIQAKYEQTKAEYKAQESYRNMFVGISSQYGGRRYS